ncbi:hypothetical protein HDV06_003858 [Boothiomyces sp. JEL0866]|nr:hypothetical protein HDV06_003858 [Boothiomyces sp. JEL0866]
MEEDEEQKTNNYAWEEQYKRSWDVLKEDENGSILKSVMALKKKKTNRIDLVVQRGIIRQLVIIIDCSRTMAELDLRPNRLDHTLTLLSSYFTEFLDQNPLSSILLLATKDGLGERLSDWLASPASLSKIVLQRYTPSGEPSLQNSLELARQALITVPNHVSREILVLYGALNTCDPGDLNQTIDKLKTDSIRVSIINLSAQMHICEMICKSTGGTFTVVQNQGHYRDLLFNTIPPPPLITKSQMIQMGFPNTIQVKDISHEDDY